jgi:plasmid stability protein
VVDKNNTLMIRNVSEETHKNLRILALVTDKQQAEVLADLLKAEVEKRDELIFKKL